MHKSFALRFSLMNAVEATPIGAASGAPQPPAAPTTQPAANAPPAEKLTLVQQLKAAVQSKEGLMAKVVTAEAAMERLTAENAALTTRAETAEARVKVLESEQAEIKQTLDASQKEAKDLAAKETDLSKRANAATKEQMAQLGFPAAKLPAAADALASQEKGSVGILARFKAETDPEKKAQLHKEYNAAVAAEKKARSV